MSGRSAIWFPLALLAMLAALTLWIDRTVQPPQPKIDGSSRHDPDYRVNNFSTTKSDLNGNPRYVLSASELVHYPDDDSAELARPRFTQYAINKPYTQIQGQRGQVSSNGDDVYFMDHVQLVRAATPGRGELTMLTEYLHLIPEKDLAVTDKPVSILQAPHTVVRGTGMEFNKKERTLKLFGRVHVHYEKPGAGTKALSGPPALKAVSATRKQRAVAVPAIDAAGAKPQAAVAKMLKKKSAPTSVKRPIQTKTQTGKTTSRIRRVYEKPAN
jgi:lipopolysaccharide export system protein LptC